MKRDVIKKLVYGMGIQPGQVVLLNFWGEEEERETLHMFSQEVAAIGGCPVEWMQSRKLNKELYKRMDIEFSDKYYQIFDSVDLVIDIIMQDIGRLDSEFPKDKIDLYKKYMSTLFSKLMNKEKLIQITMPTEKNAKESGLDPELYKKIMNDAFDIDYEQLKKNCEERIENFKKKDTVTVVTGNGCKLYLELTGREWYIDAGDGALPCGEIYIAPVEGKAHGEVFFEQLAVEGVAVYPNVTVNVKDGKIVSSTCEEFNEFLTKVPENGDVIAELGIGMNPRVDRFYGYSLIDEKVIGSFHIAIGENRMFGGQNACQFHMDFVAMGTVE